MNARKIFFVLSLTVVVATVTVALRAQSGEPSVQQEFAPQAAVNGQCDWLCRLREQQAQRLEGSWMLTVNAVVPPGTPPPPARTAYASFARGGVTHLYERREPQAGYFNPAYGAWEHRGGAEFAFTVVGDAFDPAGNLIGVVRLSNRVTLTSADEFFSVGQLEVRNLAGVLLFSSGCATARGQRIKVEPLPEPCRNIAPPQ